MLCNTSRTGLPAECHVFTIEPDRVPENDVEGVAHLEEPPVVDDIVSLRKTLGLEMNETDIQKLGEEHEQELTTDLHREQQ
jgi:hypothetical protein